MATNGIIEQEFKFSEEGMKAVQLQVEQLRAKLLQIKIDDSAAKALKSAEKEAEKLAAKQARIAEQMSKPFAALRQQFDGLNQKISSVAMPLIGIQSAISLITQAFSGLNSVLSATVGEAVKLETTMGKIQNISAGADTKKLTQDVLALSTAYGRSAQDIAQQVRETIALGIADNVTDATTIVGKALEGSIATYSDLGTAIAGAGKLMQVFGLEAEDTSKIIAMMEVAANEGSATMEQLAQQVGQFATIAGMSGAKLEEVMAVMGTLTKVDDASSAAANMQNIFQKLLNPTDELATLFQKLGWESAKTEIKQRGFLQVLKELRQAELKYVGDGKAFRDMQAQKAYGQLIAAQGMEAYERTIVRLGTAEDALKQKFELAMSSSEERMKRLKETFNVTLLRIGIMLAENVLPPVLKAAEQIAEAITGVVNVVKAFAGVITELSTADWTAIAVGAGAATIALVALNKTAILALLSSIPAIIPMLVSLASTIAAIALPVSAVVAAFVASYVATRMLMENLEALADIIVGTLAAAFGVLLDVVATPFKLLLKGLGMVSSGAKKMADDFDTYTSSIEKNGKERINKGFSGLKMPNFAADIQTIKDVVSGVAGSFNSAEKATNSIKKNVKNTQEESKKIDTKTEEWIKAEEALQKMRERTQDMINKQQEMPDIMKRYYEEVLNGERALAEFAKRKNVTAEQVAAFKQQVEQQKKIQQTVLGTAAKRMVKSATENELQEERAKTDKKISELEQLRDAGLTTAEETARAIEQLRQEQFDREMARIQQTGDEQIRVDENVADERRAATRNVAAGVVGKMATEDDSERQKAKLAAQQGVVEGFSAARSGVGSFMTFVASKFGFVGQIIAGVIELISSPEAAKTFVDSFFGAGIWQFVQQILNNIGNILVKGIIENIPKATQALIGFLILGIPEFIANLIAGLADGLTNALSMFADTKIWEQMATSMFNAFKKAITSIKKLFTSLFTGKKSSTESTTTAYSAAGGGGTSASAGGKEEFAIREYRAAEGAEGTAEDTAQSEQDSMKSIWGDFLDWLKKGWEQVKDIVGSIGKFINEWMNPIELIKKAVEEIGHFFGVSEEKVKSVTTFINEWLNPIELIKKAIDDIGSKFDVIKNSQPFQLIAEGFNSMIGFITLTWNSFKNIFNIGNIWQSVQDGFNNMTAFISRSWNLLKNDFTLGNIWQVVQDGFNTLAQNIKTTWATIKQTLSIDRIFDAVSKSFNDLISLIQNSWQNVKNILKIDDIFEIIRTGYAQLKNDISSSWQSVKNIFNFGNIWQTVQDTFNSFTGYIKTSWNSLKNDFSFGNIWSIVQNGFDNLKTNIMNGWASVKSTLNIGRVFDALSDSFDSMKNKVVGAWEYLKSILKINNIFEPVQNGFENLILRINSIWDAIKAKFNMGNPFAALENGFDNLSSRISGAWDSLKAKFTVPNPFTALENGWNNLVGKFTNWSGFDLGSKLRLNIDYKGKGTVENFLGIDFPWAKFAAGGQVPGRALFGGDTERNDVVPALLSPGEFVVPRSVMAQPGVAELMRALMSGNSMPGYARGGVIKAAWGIKRIAAAVVTGGASEAARAVGLPPPDEYANIRETFNGLNAVLGGLDIKSFAKDPTGYIGGIVRNKIGSFADLKKLYGFSEGGIVPGPASGDVVPALLSGGEAVLNRQQQADVRNATQPSITVNINVAAGATLDRPAVERALPLIIDAIRRQSMNGTQVLSTRGLRPA